MGVLMSGLRSYMSRMMMVIRTYRIIIAVISWRIIRIGIIINRCCLRHLRKLLIMSWIFTMRIIGKFSPSGETGV